MPREGQNVMIETQNGVPRIFRLALDLKAMVELRMALPRMVLPRMVLTIRTALIQANPDPLINLLVNQSSNPMMADLRMVLPKMVLTIRTALTQANPDLLI